jgi:hypothetical protein
MKQTAIRDMSDYYKDRTIDSTKGDPLAFFNSLKDNYSQHIDSLTELKHQVNHHDFD